MEIILGKVVTQDWNTQETNQRSIKLCHKDNVRPIKKNHTHKIKAYINIQIFK